jgi:hypothetical protein
VKTALGIMTGVFLGGIIVFVGLITTLRFFGPFQASQDDASGIAVMPSPGPIILISPTPVISTVTGYSPSPAIAAPVTSAPVIRRIPAEKINVKFGLSITGVSGSGFSRTVSARITNSGANAAHNTNIKVEAYYQGSRVKLGGKDYIQQNLGTLRAGETRQVEATLSFNITDGTRILKNGVEFVITLSSDENTQFLNYHYTP